MTVDFFLESEHVRAGAVLFPLHLARASPGSGFFRFCADPQSPCADGAATKKCCDEHSSAAGVACTACDHAGDVAAASGASA